MEPFHFRNLNVLFFLTFLNNNMAEIKQTNKMDVNIKKKIPKMYTAIEGTYSSL